MTGVFPIGLALIEERLGKPKWALPEHPPQAVRVCDPAELWAVNPANPARLTVFA